MTAIRPAAVAGTFYPGDPGQLAAMVDDLVAAGRTAAAPPKALIAPHAGYVYSGPVAGRAFGTLGEGAHGVERVVVIGPTHHVAIRGLAVPSAEAFRTPLGDVPVDVGALDAIRGLPQVVTADLPHIDEHALEVELPFLQRRLERLTLVPIVVGDAAPGDVATVLDTLWGGDETLIVVSSDLSHYHDDATARRLDAATAATIEALDGAALGPEDACGFLAIAGLLETARRRGLGVERLDLRNSGATRGPKHRVVGYGAWAFREPAAQA